MPKARNSIWLAHLFFLTIVLISREANSQFVTLDWFPVVETVLGPDNSLLGGTGIGTLTYDSAQITGRGFESITADQGLTVELELFGQTFTQIDERDYNENGPNDFPRISFVDGDPFGVLFRVYESAFVTNPTMIDLFGVEFFEVSELSPLNSGGFGSAVLVSTVPEPFGLWWFAFSFYGMLGMRPSLKPMLKDQR